MSEAVDPIPAPDRAPVLWRLLSDERLALRATKGDARAFEEIYRRYHQDLYRFCLATTGRSPDAQDALQNTMVKVLRALPGEEREIKLKPWLYRIARNESVETLRRRHDSDELEPQHSIDAGIAERAEARDRLRTLLADLDHLPERQRSAVVMRELSGLDFAEIGAVFGSSPAVARQTLYEARLSLRQLEEGREMRCAEVMREISDSDGRVSRRREIQAHLRGCADCRAFRDGISERHGDLAALAPLPVAASAALLHGALGQQAGAAGVSAAFGGGAGPGAAGAGGGSVTGGVGAGAGKAIATSALAKTAATVAVVAVAGGSALDRTGVVDLLPSGGEGGKAAKSAAPPHRRSEQAGGSAANGADRADERRGPHPGARDGSPRTDGAEGGAQQAAAARRLGHQARSPSRSDSGKSPPGGGHGRSAAENRGRPEQLPSASSHGQETAARHKAPPATSPTPNGSPPAKETPAAPIAGNPAPKAPAEDGPPEAKPPAPEPPGATAESPLSPEESRPAG